MQPADPTPPGGTAPAPPSIADAVTAPQAFAAAPRTVANDPALRRLAEQIRAAQVDDRPLEIVGGGSKRFYGELPQGEPLSMRELAGVSSYEPSELVVTVRAGTPLVELETLLAQRGQCLPFEPPHFEVPHLELPPLELRQSQRHDQAPADAPCAGGSVGGMVAAGLAGPARASVGSVRDYVLGASMLDGRGELLSFGGQVMKNVAGYDVSRLLAGSLGVLGLICEVSLKVLPVAPRTATLRFELGQQDALHQLNRWAGQPLPLSASAWWDGMLVLRLAGADAAVQAAQRQLGGELIEPAMAEPFWRGLRDQTDEFFIGAQHAITRGNAALWRLSVPQTAPVLALSGEQLLEWGGAQRWLVSALPADAVRDAANAVGGHATRFKASQRTPGVFAPLSAPLARIHRELKSAFDPARILNRGRLYPDL